MMGWFILILIKVLQLINLPIMNNPDYYLTLAGDRFMDKNKEKNKKNE